MKNLSRALILFVLFSFGCSPGDRSSGGSTPAQAPIVQGTVSGGGGNGCDGKAFETYAKKISTLEEYRIYLRPILRKMSEGGNDPFATYLQWAAEEKAWYFIPCELQKLSAEQTGVAVLSDQLALQSEHGIFIHSIESDRTSDSYFSKKSKAKAALLLHEMVMGARLLMKKSAAEQCAALAKRGSKVCSDPAVMALVDNSEVDAKESMIMDAGDHDSVRAMTVYLADRNADYGAEKIRSVRERLGFKFPWSRVVSEVDGPQLMKAFLRSQTLEDRFEVFNTTAEAGKRTTDIYFKGQPATCGIGYETTPDGARGGLQLHFVSKLKVNNKEDARLFKQRFSDRTGWATCASKADRVFQSTLRNGNYYTQSPCADPTPMFGFESSLYVNLADDWIAARGVSEDGVVYDEITIKNSSSYTFAKLLGVELLASETRILVTRGDAPRIYSVRFRPMQFLVKPDRNSPAHRQGKIATRDGELIEIPTMPAIECRLTKQQ